MLVVNSENEKPARRNLLRWVMRMVTVIISAAILYYFLRGEDWESLREAASMAEVFPATMGVILPLLVFWFTDTAFTVKSFQWFHRPVRFRDYMVIKAAMYLLTMVNITLATGGVFLYFARKVHISFSKQAGLLMWRVNVAVFGYVLLFTLFVFALWSLSPGVISAVRMRDWAPVLAFLLLLMVDWWIFWTYGKGVISRRLASSFKSEWWSAFRQSGMGHWLAGWGYTVPAIVVDVLGMYIVALSFNVEVPFFYFLFWMPVVLVLSALPIAFGGFGTTTAAWMVFFSNYADPADIAAATIFIPGVRLILRSMLGLAFLAPAMKELEGLSGRS